MKLLEPSKAPEWRARATCNTCGAVVELEPEDLTMHDDDLREGLSFAWRCPTAGCNQTNWLAADVVPREVRHLIRGAR